MDEAYKTMRTIYLAFLTLCFVSSMFLASIRNTHVYGEVAAALKELIDARAYLYPSGALNEAISAAQDAARSEAIRKIKEALRDFGVLGRLIDEITVPSTSIFKVYDEKNSLLVNRRGVELDHFAQVFKLDSVDVSAANNRRKELKTLCSVSLDHDSGSVRLSLWHARDNENDCIGKDAIDLPVLGGFVDVPGTSFRDWITSKGLFKPPLFVGEASGRVTFLKVDDDLWSEILNKKPAEAFEYLVSQASKSPGKIKLFEVEIEKSLLSWVIPTLMLIILLTLYLHVEDARRSALRRKDQSAPGVPFIGTFESTIAKWFYFVSLVIWPLGIAIVFSIQLYEPTLSFILTVFLWCIVALCGVATFVSSQQLARVTPK
jgi:hypothetical protein